MLSSLQWGECTDYIFNVIHFKMWSYAFGTFISLYMLINEVSDSVLLRLLPLYVLCILSIVAILFDVSQKKTVLHSTFIGSMAFSVTLLTTFHDVGWVSLNQYLVVSNCVLLAIVVSYIVLSGQLIEMVYLQFYNKCLYMLSVTLSVLTYTLFYAVEFRVVDPLVPLGLFFLVLLIEWLIINQIRQKSDGTRDEFNKEMSMSRINYAICLFIIFVSAIAHYIWQVSDIFLYTAAFISYVVGGLQQVYAHSENLHQNYCFGRSSHQLLRNGSDDV